MANEGGFKNYLFALILTSLFGVLILSTVIDMGNEYSLETDNLANGSLNITAFNDNINSFEDDAEDMQEAFATGNIFSVIAGLVVDVIFGLVIDMISIILEPFRLVNNILIDGLGVPKYVTSVLMGMLIFSLIFSIWRLLKIGD